MSCKNCKHQVYASLKSVPVRENGFIWFDTVEVPRHCGKGFDSVFENWWKVNGPKPAGTVDENPPVCFEPHESDVALDSLLSKTKELLSLLKAENSKTEIFDRSDQFSEGDQVIYCPDHSTGLNDPVNERGVVSKVEGSGIDAKVWVRYSTGSTGALTPLKNLVKA